MTPGSVPEGPHPPTLMVSVSEIRRHLGSRMPVRRDLEATGLALPDVGVAVVDGADIRFEGEAESISDGVVLTGTVTVPWTGPCRRCLRDLTGLASADVREVYETHPVDGETWPLANNEIDLGPLLHDTALLALPLAPLCGDDCQGPDPERFPAAVEADADDEDSSAADDGPPRDPRWAALDDLEL